MDTIKQRFKAIIKDFKTDIRLGKGRLLTAAVVLFCLSWAVVYPVKGIESLLVPDSLVEDKSIITEQASDESPPPLQDSLPIESYLMTNTLASLNPVDQPESEESDTDTGFRMIFVQNTALLAQTSPITLISQKPRDEIVTYTVQDGDTPSVIAASFGISLNTLFWANKLNSYSIIRPGDELTILPVTGVLHRVKSNQTIDWIAKYYKGDIDEITAFNGLPADGTIQIGQKLIIPDGRIPVIIQPTRVASRTNVTGAGTGKSRAFPYGQCTWYVAQKRVVPWSGHAKAWLVNAQAYGYQTGSTPQVGAIMVLTEGGWIGLRYGHVAYVESVNGNWVTISEMNYNCAGCKSVRTLKVTDSRIRGYIY